MEHKRHAVWATARTEYIKWVTDPRMILVAVLLIFFYQTAVSPLMEMAVEMGEKLNVLEPFIAVANSPLLMLLIPLVFITLISDFPRTDGNTVFFIHRIGRTSWMWGQMLFVLMAMGSYIAVIFLGTTLPVLFQSQWGMEWSLTVRQYYLNFPEKSGSFAAQLITARLYNQVQPLPAVLQTYLMQVLYLMLFALILLWFWLQKKKGIGIFAVIFLVGIGTAFSLLEGKLMWIFPMAHTNVWLHYTALLREPLCPFWCSYLYFAVPILLLSLWNIWLVRRYNFLSITEIE